MTFAIYTLGCKVNTYESEFITHLFKSHKYKEVSFKETADIYIINTCTVTNTADSKSKKIINQTRKLNPKGIVIVCGCYSQYMKGNISNADGIDIIIGNKDKSKLVEIVEKYIKNKKNIIKIYNMKNQDFEDMKIERFETQTRAFIKIQDGCNNYCSYCIIPFVRGNVRSKKLNVVVNEVKDLVNNGHKEIVLTGIHTGQYGNDIKSSLTDLLKELKSIEGLKRIRISSIEITELDNYFLDELKNNNLIVDHLHVPLQSGNDKILKLMNRKYNTEYFENKIKEIRNIRPDISITTDVIVGFPGESNDDFKNTVEFIKKIKFSKLHVFPYSKRNGTKAAIMDNQIDEKIKKERVKTLLDVSLKLEQEYHNLFVGKELEVLFERNVNNKYIGHTSNFLEIKTTKKTNIINEMLKIKIQ